MLRYVSISVYIGTNILSFSEWRIEKFETNSRNKEDPTNKYWTKTSTSPVLQAAQQDSCRRRYYRNNHFNCSGYYIYHLQSAKKKIHC
jgi:hypothetical protein